MSSITGCGFLRHARGRGVCLCFGRVSVRVGWVLFFPMVIGEVCDFLGLFFVAFLLLFVLCCMFVFVFCLFLLFFCLFLLFLFFSGAFVFCLFNFVFVLVLWSLYLTLRFLLIFCFSFHLSFSFSLLSSAVALYHCLSPCFICPVSLHFYNSSIGNIRLKVSSDQHPDNTFIKCFVILNSHLEHKHRNVHLNALHSHGYSALT